MNHATILVPERDLSRTLELTMAHLQSKMHSINAMEIQLVVELQNGSVVKY